MQEQGLTENELQAARIFLARNERWLILSPAPDECSACRGGKLPSGVRLAKHKDSKPHIAGVYKIPLGRLNTAIKVAKVMAALDG